jgi:prevent-host-death family protein
MQTTVQISEARKQLGELVNEAYYAGKPFQLVKGSKPMAMLIGTKEFREMLKIIEAHDPGLADTLAIMANPEVQAILDEGEEDVKAGRTILLEDVLRDL